MRVAVLGASGLIGSAVAVRLESDHHLIRIGRRGDADIRMDLADPRTVDVIDLARVDALVHCAGVIDEDFREDPQRAFVQATAGAAALAARAAKAGVCRLAYVSSAHVYGPLVGSIGEEAPINPLSDYAIAHFASEQMFRRVGGAAVAVFRPCAVFGLPPDLAVFRRWSLIPFSFPRDAVTSGRIVLTSTGEQRRNFVATTDIAEAIATWLNAAVAPGFQIVNPVGRANLTVWEFAQRCAGLAECITGMRCALQRVDPTGPMPGREFEYHTRDPRFIGSAELEPVLRELMQRILGQREERELDAIK